MLNVALLLVLVSEVAFFTYFDKKIFGNYFSPVVLLSYPVIIILVAAILFSTQLDFFPVSNYVMLLFIAGTFVFWLGSFFWSIIIPNGIIYKIAEGFRQAKPHVSQKLKRIFLLIAWVIIVWMMASFVITLRKFGSITALGSDEFSTSYGGSGISGHILGLAMPLLIFFISIAKKRDYLTILTIAFLVLLFLLYRVKTWLFVPLIGGILLRYYNEGRIKIRIIPILVSIILILVLFISTYAFSMKEQNIGFWERIYLLLKHFLGYVFAGVLGFGEHIKNDLPLGDSPKALFMPVINLYNFIFGNEVSGVVSPHHVFIDRRGLEDVNVKTFFGTILINGGYLFGIIYTFVLSIFLYFIWIVASLSRNYWFLILYIFFAAALVLGWFDFYYNQLPFLELPVFMIIIIFLTRN